MTLILRSIGVVDITPPFEDVDQFPCWKVYSRKNSHTILHFYDNDRFYKMLETGKKP